MICACDKGAINILDIESYFLSLKAPWLYAIKTVIVHGHTYQTTII